MRPTGTSSRALGVEVVRYLLRRPDATDTVQGIARWWLSGRFANRGIAEVEAALSDLVADGLVLTRRHGDGQLHYRFNRKKEAELREEFRRVRDSEPGKHCDRE
jgi:hypothetical protein